MVLTARLVVRIPLTGGDVNSYAIGRVWLALVLICVGLLLLSGCQTLAGNSTGNAAVTLNPTQINFGSVAAGSSQQSSITISNTGTADLVVNQAALSGAGFTMSNLTLPMTLHAGSSSSAKLTFAPPNSGSFTGNVAFTTNAGNASLALSGTGTSQGQLTPNPTSLSFGTVGVGSSTSLSGTLTNSGGTSLTISAASANGTGFSLNGLTLPATLSPGQSTNFSVTFAPAGAGAASGSVSITSNGVNANLSIPLSGTGGTPGSLSANPTSLGFGNVQTGSTGSLSETVTNTGGATVTITQANVTPSTFSVTGLNPPTTLTGGQSVTFTVHFAPTSAGSVTGTLSLVSNASNSPTAISLSGTGTVPGQLAVTP